MIARKGAGDIGTSSKICWRVFYCKVEEGEVY
jgi:hypothetical protein